MAVCRHCQKSIPRDPLTDLLTVTLRYPIRHLYALLWRAGILDIGV